MILCRTVVIKFMYLEILTQALQQISTDRGGAPTIRRWWRADAKFRRRGLLKLGGGGLALAVARY
jgi:hypothetical protein